MFLFEHSVETYSIRVMINGLGECIPDATVSEEEKTQAPVLLEKHKDEIRDILRATNELWGDEIAK